MKSTYARKFFKKNFGQANHFLITCLVGLDVIENGTVAKSNNFSTTWNPKSPINSARRSRDFVLEAFLSRLVDGLDVYLSILHKNDFYLSNINPNSVFDPNEKSIYKKIDGTSNYFLINDYLCSLVKLSIIWRNLSTHYFTSNSNKLDYVDIVTLKKNKEDISKNFCRLDIEDILRKYETTSPTFKEVASLINAIHKYVEKVDDLIISKINKNDYFLKTINTCFKDHPELYNKYYILLKDNDSRRKIFIKNLLQNMAHLSSEDLNVVNFNELISILNK